MSVDPTIYDRALKAEAAIQRVRELHHVAWRDGVGYVCAGCGDDLGPGNCRTWRALDGDA